MQVLGLSSVQVSPVYEELEKAVSERILILDGGMGTMLQQYKLEEEDYRGKEFASWHKDLKGNNDLLCLTQPDIVREVHQKYLEAGADIVETNTFNAQAVSQGDYEMSHLSRRINLEAAKLCREAAENVHKNTGRRCFVAGGLGPTHLSVTRAPPSSTMNNATDINAHFSNITYDEIVEAYSTQAMALLDGGVDMILIETFFDCLNAKAALFAVNTLFEDKGYTRVPILVSGTVYSKSGAILSGQTVDEFYLLMCGVCEESTRLTGGVDTPCCVGLNCNSCNEMKPYIERLSQLGEGWVSCYPNAGLPNAMGGYDETPEMMAADLKKFAEAGWLNIVGGCCGTTPAHIKAIADVCRGLAPRKKADKK